MVFILTKYEGLTMALVQFNSENVTNTKQFNTALSNVFKGIQARNEQVQQLLIVAVGEAARESGGQVTNNLDWLTRILVMAQDTKGINLVKLVRYVKEVLCCNTVSWNSEKSRLAKVQDKAVKLTYNLTPDVTWFNHGKKETVAKAFDYGKRVTSAVSSAMNMEKGGLTLAEIMQAVAEADGVTIHELMEAVAAVNPMQEVA